MRSNFFHSILAAGFAPAVWLMAAAPLAAQVAPIEQLKQVDKRVTVLESQMRAVQRQVFPGGDKRFFQPEIAPAPPPETAAPGSPATPALVDLGQRVTALETQQRTLTGQIEQLQHQMRLLEAAVQKSRTDAEARIDALEGKGGPTAPATPAAAVALPTPAPAAPAAAKPDAAPPPKPATATPAATADADALEARYREGYGLYTAGDYAAAYKALSDFAEANPKHARASNAQFWAGRALLAQGKTADAAKAFLGGYQKFPRGERAHNSLLWLGKSLVDLKQPAAACQALDQLTTAYPDRITGQFANDLTAARTQAKCAATASPAKPGQGKR